MHFVIYLPSGFYSAIASTFIEILQAINDFKEPKPFTFEFVSPSRQAISWWLKKEVQDRFPKVKWEASRILVRDGRVYTSGGGFSELELITTLLSDLGFSAQERRVRKLMVLPSSRQFQSPYEFSLDKHSGQLEKKLNRLFKDNPGINISIMAKQLGMSSRNMARKFFDELQISPGKWIQTKRIDMAKTLLEESKLSISEICYHIGFEDPSSFSRLFSKVTGMGPIEFRKQLQHLSDRKKLKQRI